MEAAVDLVDMAGMRAEEDNSKCEIPNQPAGLHSECGERFSQSSTLLLS